MSERSRLSLPVVAAGASPDAPGCRDAAEPHPDEFSRGLSVWDELLSRRNFLSVTAASSIAVLASGGCSDRPNEPIVPYVDPPEQVLAGEPQFFATTLTRDGYGRGVIVTSREGRPTKIEGNPDHPASLGAADARTQAAVLDLYDPKRSKAVTHAGVASTWGEFVKALQAQLATHAADGGDGLAVLTGPIGSPATIGLLDEVKRRFPKAAWHVHDPLRSAPRPHDMVYDLSNSDIIVSFDSDFLNEDPGSLAYARQFIEGRRVSGARPTMNRLYVAESDFSVTGSRADHRLPVRPSRVGQLLLALATQMGVGGVPMPTDLNQAEAAWLSAVATDLAAHHGRSLVIVGRNQGGAVQDAAEAINLSLGNVGRTVRYIEPVLRNSQASDDGAAPLAKLCSDIAAGRVRTLLILDGNPTHTAAGDVPFARCLADLSVRPNTFTAHLGPHADETSYACQWHVPAQHELEQWCDARAYDGSASIVQPLIAPMTNGKSPIDVINVILGQPDRSAYDTVRTAWQAKTSLASAPFESWWADVLRKGVVSGSDAVSLASDQRPSIRLPSATASGIEVLFRPDPSIGDGSGFHNPWLQELPRPMTKLVWGNAGLVAPAFAYRKGLSAGDVLRLDHGGRKIEIPILPVAGIADDTVVLHLGYGHHRVFTDAPAGPTDATFGTDVYPLQSGQLPAFLTGVTVTPAGRRESLVRTHHHHTFSAAPDAEKGKSEHLVPRVVATPETPHDELALSNRKLIRTATLGQFFNTPGFAADMDTAHVDQLYRPWDYSTGPQWGMTIDMTACIGCNACVVACQAENNIPSVGPEQVAKQREMHWLRVDSYRDDAGRVHHQPVACMHCENAPCEYVCPVAATTHSVDGLNQMTYNRCVGTRYCSNNCPYKVRRFNFLNYTAYQPEPYAMQRNPDVTVRTRGVMEKCTYCVQRLVYADRKVEIATVGAGEDADRLRRELFGRVQTACQQTCPTQAIHFGDLTNADSEVAKSKQSPLNYGLLTELSTKPRTTYLASITNPSASMEPAS